MVVMVDKSVLILDYICDIIFFVEVFFILYYVVVELMWWLEQVGFQCLEEIELWLFVEGCWYVVWDGVVIVWIILEKVILQLGVRIVGFYIDFLFFKFKLNVIVINQGWQQVGMEVYGGGLLNFWFDCDFGLFGCFVICDGQVYLV